MGLAACLRYFQDTGEIFTMGTSQHNGFLNNNTQARLPVAKIRLLDSSASTQLCYRLTKAPNGHCEVGAKQQGGQPEQQWCSREGPVPKLSSTAARSQSVVCRDLVPTPVERPWCRRGLLVPAIRPRNEPISEIQMRPDYSQPKSTKHSEHTMSGPSASYQNRKASKPWCNFESKNREYPESPRGLQPKGCQESAKPNISIAIGDCDRGMVAAKVGTAPQQHASRFKQPEQYLQKLCDKHPRPMAVVTATPRDELMHRVYADRYRTTYQSDYCKNADDAARLIGKCDTYDPDLKPPTFNILERLVESQPSTGFVTCKCGCGCHQAVPSSGDVPRIRPIACRPAVVSDNVHFSCCTPKKKIGSGSNEEEVGPPQKIPPWASEYTDGIGRTGQIIFDQKLLHPKKKNKNEKYF